MVLVHLNTTEQALNVKNMVLVYLNTTKEALNVKNIIFEQSENFVQN